MEAHDHQSPRQESALSNRQWGSVRASALIICLMVLLSLALVGPNRIHELLTGTAAASSEVAKENSHEIHSTHYVESAAREPLAAHRAPRLEPPPATGSRQNVSPAEAESEVALAGHAAPQAAPGQSSYAFREPAEQSQDQMQAVQHRLQLLGARYMLLETWGDVSPQYRFLCHTVDRQGNVVKHEFVSNDPLYAMQRVLYQVEQRLAAR